MKKGKKASKKMTALIVPVMAASLLLPIGSAFAAQATGIDFSASNFMGVYPNAKITAHAQGISTPMYQWWVKAPGAADAKCVLPYSQDNDLGFNELDTTPGKYEMWVTTVDETDYNNGNPNVDNTKTQYAFAYKDAAVQLTKAEVVNGKLEVAASATNIANPDFQFWFSNNPSDSNSWQCSYYGLGSERSIDLGGATGTFKVIAYAKDIDGLDNVKYTVWSGTEDVTVGDPAGEPKLTECKALGGGMFWSLTGKYAEGVSKVEVIYNDLTKEAVLKDGTFSWNVMSELKGKVVVFKAYEGEKLVDTQQVTVN